MYFNKDPWWFCQMSKKVILIEINTANNATSTDFKLLMFKKNKEKHLMTKIFFKKLFKINEILQSILPSVHSQ